MGRGRNHGLSRTPEYYTWLDMKKRCYDKTRKNYHRYGGRGITVCDRWRNSFLDFIADMGPRPSCEHLIERIDNDGNYEPDNCEWATRAKQNRNRCTTRMITYKGETHCLTDWAEVMGLPRIVLVHRLDRGWELGRALTQPVRRYT